MGNTNRSERNDDHRRHDHDCDQGWNWRTHIKVQLRSDDWPAPARLREKAGQLCTVMWHANKFLQLRSVHSTLGIVVASESAARRIRRNRGLPALQENRHRGRSDFCAGGIRLGGELREFW